MEFSSQLLRNAEKHIQRLQRTAYKALMDGNQRKFVKQTSLINPEINDSLGQLT
jgi:hypothetical protein